ncbi:unnamed protein product [Gongylonema pulchrum]|uniref:ADP-ribosylation factor-related protein 1 n=1 Tax=Gongylonema pulchrum TaxID=637853 RepID=A0A3P7N299_9BILA|nr:unnamed protein product [Gongylonema pulchrum]
MHAARCPDEWKRMYTLGTGIWQRLTQKSNYYIVIVGLDNAGKTTFLEQIKSRFICNYQMLNPLNITSTVGLNVGSIDLGSIRLNFWDLGGQDELQSLWHKYFDDCQALIFVVDSCDPQRFPEVGAAFMGSIDLGSIRLNFWDLGGQDELQSLWHKYFDDCQALVFVVDSCDPQRFPEVGAAFRLVMDSEAVQKMPVLVVSNKSDLEECAGTEEIKDLTSDDRHLGDLALIPISALQGLNIERCVRWLCTVLKTNRNNNDLS